MDVIAVVLAGLVAGCFAVAAANFARALDATPVVIGRRPPHAYPAEAKLLRDRAGWFSGVGAGLCGLTWATGDWFLGLALLVAGVSVMQWLRWQHNRAVAASAGAEMAPHTTR